jgi:hypothetical protein
VLFHPFLIEVDLEIIPEMVSGTCQVTDKEDSLEGVVHGIGQVIIQLTVQLIGSGQTETDLKAETEVTIDKLPDLIKDDNQKTISRGTRTENQITLVPVETGIKRIKTLETETVQLKLKD